MEFDETDNEKHPEGKSVDDGQKKGDAESSESLELDLSISPEITEEESLEGVQDVEETSGGIEDIDGAEDFDLSDIDDMLEAVEDAEVEDKGELGFGEVSGIVDGAEDEKVEEAAVEPETTEMPSSEFDAGADDETDSIDDIEGLGDLDLELELETETPPTAVHAEAEPAAEPGTAAVPTESEGSADEAEDLSELLKELDEEPTPGAEAPPEGGLTPLEDEVAEEDIFEEVDAILPKEIEEEGEEAEEAAIKKPKAKGIGDIFKELLGSKAEKEAPKYEVEKYDPKKHGPMSVFEGVEDYVEVERYWVDEPYAFVVVLFQEDTDTYLYYMVEPKLTPFEEGYLNELKNRLQSALLVTEVGEGVDKEGILRENIDRVLIDYGIELEPISYYKITYYVVRDYIELGRLTPVTKDKLIEDISCNGYDNPIFLYHKNYTNIETNVTYGKKELDSFIIMLAQRGGKHISVSNPMVDAAMPDGSRIQMTLGEEITTHGSTFTIRKFKDVPLSPVDLIIWKTFSSEQMAYIWLCIENAKSLIFAGGTASGKTSSLNAVALFMPPKAKIITLEDTREVQLPHLNWIPGLTREAFTPDGSGAVDMYELLRAALRQRPEYIIVGEVRGKEAITLFQAMSTGHTTFSTLHADSVDTAIHRLENPPISVPRTMIEALDIISIQAQTYTKGKRVRRNMNIVEIAEVDAMTKAIKTIDIFKWDSATDTFPNVGISKALEDIRVRRAWSTAELREQLEGRRKVLDHMVQKDIKDYRAVAKIIRAYMANQDKTLEKLGLK